MQFSTFYGTINGWSQPSTTDLGASKPLRLWSIIGAFIADLNIDKQVSPRVDAKIFQFTRADRSTINSARPEMANLPNIGVARKI
jgi:hypothetical protein